MLKNRIWLGIILSIILLVFSINGFTAYYKYTQESGANFYVASPDKADALEDTNEIRQIIDDLGNLLDHSKRDDLYPKDETTGGTLAIPNSALVSFATGTKGDLFYCSSANVWTKLSVGADNQVLIVNVDVPNWEDFAGGGYTDLTEFVDQTAWRLFYSNNLGDVIELALGTDGQYLKSTGATSAPIFDTPGGAGDMLKATYDTDEDGDVDVAAGGTEKSSWTLYAIPYLSGTAAFGEITIGTVGQVLKVAAGATGYEFADESGGGYSNIVVCADYDHPDDAITAIGADLRTLLVTEAETCDANFTVPANVKVRFERGGKWTINTGITVTFNGQIDAGLWQIFAYVGTGVIDGTPKVKEVYPQWWGAIINDNSKYTENTDAFNEAFKYKNVFISEGIYYLNALDSILHEIKIIGIGLSTVLMFDATTDCITLDQGYDYPTSHPLDEGTSIQDIRFDNITNVPSAFINVKTSRNTRLVGLRFFNATATVGILNTKCYGLELQKCKWNVFTGIGLKLLSDPGDSDFSNEICLIDCDFSNITGVAIEQEGGDIEVIGGVIEDSDTAGMVKLGTTSYCLNASFIGTFFEGTDAVFVKGATDTDNPVFTASFLGCTFLGSGNSVDIGIKGLWSFISCRGGTGGLLIETTTAHDTNYVRVIMIGCSAVNLDSSVDNMVSYIGRAEVIRANTADGSSVKQIFDSSGDSIFKIDDTGKVTLTRGQMAFPATQVPDAGANVLDDYEEEAWTPALKFGGNSVGMAYTTQAGLYTKIGRQVTLTCCIKLSAKGTSEGAATINGLPFTSKNADGAITPATLWLNGITFANVPQAYIDKNTTVIVLAEVIEDGTVSTLTEGNFANTSDIRISVTYFTG